MCFADDLLSTIYARQHMHFVHELFIFFRVRPGQTVARCIIIIITLPTFRKLQLKKISYLHSHIGIQNHCHCITICCRYYHNDGFTSRQPLPNFYILTDAERERDYFISMFQSQSQCLGAVFRLPRLLLLLCNLQVPAPCISLCYFCTVRF
jgi:hypothetical protein